MTGRGGDMLLRSFCVMGGVGCYAGDAALSGAPRRDRAKAHDADRGAARARGYDSRWDKASRSYRRAHPLCAYCALEGEVSPARLVDHLYPHRVYDGVFWEKQWWVASCHACHSGMKQRAERVGKAALDDLAKRLGRPLL